MNFIKIIDKIAVVAPHEQDTQGLFLPAELDGPGHLVGILIQRAVKCRKTNTPFINLHARILVENWDKVSLIGTFVPPLLYPFAMNLMHFLWASILFIFLFNVLFCGIDKIALVKNGGGLKNEGIRSLLISLLVSVIASTLIWFIFGYVFRITLP